MTFERDWNFKTPNRMATTRDLEKAVGAGGMATVDADPDSLFRLQQDARLKADRIRRGGLEVADTFTYKVDGAPGELTSGQTYNLWPAAGARTPRIVGGKLTFAPNAEAGGYASIDLVQPCTHAEMYFTLGPWSQEGGLACLAAMESDIGESYDNGMGVPASPAHLIVSPTGWSFGVFDNPGESLRVIKQGQYPTGQPLAADDSTVHYAAFDLDQDNGIAYLSIPQPDGTQQTVVVVDPSITIPAYSVFIEPFKQTGSVNESLASFVAWNAHSATTQTLGPAKDRATQGAMLPKVKVLDQAAAINLSVGSLDAIDPVNARIVGRFGPSGGALFTVGAFFVCAATADVYMCIRTPGGDIVPESSTRVQTPRLEDSAQWHTVTLPVLTGVPHDGFDLLVAAGSFGGTAAIEGGSNYHIAITAQPF